MKKLYYAVLSPLAPLDVVFVSDYDLTDYSLQIKAKNAFREQERENARLYDYKIIEPKSLEEIPKEWHNAVVYGQKEEEEELTPEIYFDKSKDPEYEIYLRLKEKFKDDEH